MTFFNNASTSKMNNTYSEPDDSVEVADVWENHFDENHSADTKKFLHLMNSSENYDRNTPFPNNLTSLDLEFIFKIIIFVLSVTANTVAIAVLINRRKMRTPTNLLLCNLLVADLMMICTPMQITDSINYLQAILVTTSAYTITTMAGNLCVAIKRFGKIPTLSNSNSTVIVIITLWILVLVLFAPIVLIIMTSEEYSTENVTLSMKRRLFNISNFIITYAIPGFLIVLTYFHTRQQLCSPNPVFNANEGSPSSQRNIRYIRERKRVAWILLLLAVLFIICWLPHHVIQLLVDYEYVPQNAVAGMMTYALLLGHTNSAINPIVYCFMTKSFSKRIKKLLCRTSSEKSSTQEQQQNRMRMRRLNRNNADTDLGEHGVTGDSQCPHCEDLMSRYVPPNPAQEVPSPQHSDFEYYII